MLEAQDDLFYLYDPAADLPPERQQPFATIVTGDHYEKVSRLDEPGAWRLNLGLTKATYTSLFGPVPTERDADWVLDSGHDYSERDKLMPHPFYASQHWVCIVSPSEPAPLLPLLHGGLRVRRPQVRQASGPPNAVNVAVVLRLVP